MQREKLAAIGLAVIIIGALSGYLALEYGDEIVDNLSGEDTKTSGIKMLGDCVDVHYIGTYADGSVFAYSYEDPVAKTGGEPLNVFMSTSIDGSESPPEEYITYTNLFAGQYYIEDFINGLAGMKIGETKTIGPIIPDESFGVRPETGDLINLTPYVQQDYVLSIKEIQENADMPLEYSSIFGNITTTLYTLREESHYIGEIIESYTFWTNSTVVAKINETMLWTYTTPTTSIDENFTFSETRIDTELGTQFFYEYPETSSYISSMDEDNITVTHNPAINTSINVSYLTDFGFYQLYQTYTVENLTDDILNVSYFDAETNGTLYSEFDRTTSIERNETQNITQDPVPGEFLEAVLFSYLRDVDPDFTLGSGPFTETVYIDVKIVDIAYEK